MAKRKCKPEEFDRICEAMDYLAHTLADMGVVQYRFDRAKREIFWDTEGGGQIDPERVEAFASLIEAHYLESLEAA